MKLTNETVIKKLKAGWVFEWIHVSPCDYHQTKEGIDVYYPQDIEEGTIWATLKDVPEIIKTLEEMYPSLPAFGDKHFKPANQ